MVTSLMNHKLKRDVDVTDQSVNQSKKKHQRTVQNEMYTR